MSPRPEPTRPPRVRKGPHTFPSGDLGGRVEPNPSSFRVARDPLTVHFVLGDHTSIESDSYPWRVMMPPAHPYS